MLFNKIKRNRRGGNLDSRESRLYHWIFLGFLLFLLLFGFLMNVFLWKIRKPSFSIGSYPFEDSRVFKGGDFDSKERQKEGESFSNGKGDFGRKGILDVRRFASLDQKSRGEERKGEGRKKESFFKAQNIKDERMKILMQEERRIRHLKIAKDFFEERMVPFFSHMGRDASLRDRLKYGDLKGRYSIRFYDGKLETMRFLEQDKELYPPIFFSSTRDFIQSYKVFFPDGLDFRKIYPYKVQKIEDQGTFFYETYYILDSSSEEQFELQFKLDSKSRLLSFKAREFFSH